MAYQGGFQRLGQSDDIAAQNPTMGYNDQYTDQYTNQHWQGNHTTSPEYDPRRMSQTSRKPVPQTQVQPLISNYFDTSPPEPIREKPQRQQTSTSVLSRLSSSLRATAPFRKVSHLAAPLFAAPWRHEPCEDLGGSKGSTVRFFDRGKQRRRIFFSLLLQWLTTALWCAIIVIIFIHYDRKETVTQNQKYRFNAAFLGLGLLLSFSVAAGLKEYVNILRWRLLARNYRNLQEFELVLGMASQKRSLRLAWVSERWNTKLICFFYVLLMLGLQIAIALLGLCQSVDTNPDLVDLVWGNVSIINSTVIAQSLDLNGQADASLIAQTGAANAYGITAQTYAVVENPSPKNITNRFSSTLFTDYSSYWSYYFVDYCPGDTCSIAYNTERAVTANAVCQEYTITAGGYADSGNVSWTYPNGTAEYLSYGDYLAVGVTTWFSDTAEVCGPRCAQMFALNMGSVPDGYGPQLFDCNNTVSHVSPLPTDVANSSVYDIPDEQARFFAGSIGYTGLFSVDSTVQYHVYDTASYWSWTPNAEDGFAWTVDDAANRVMQFSVGSVGGVDQNGLNAFVTGWSPTTAQSVSITWGFSILILGLIPGIQFLCLLITVALGNFAVVKDESFLSSARLLRPVVEKLDRNGCALTSDEICEVLGNPRVAYGVHMHNNGNGTAYNGQGFAANEVMHLGILNEYATHDNTNGEMGWRVGRPMPQGRYDGLSSSSEDEEKVGLISGARVDEKSRRRRLSF